MHTSEEATPTKEASVERSRGHPPPTTAQHQTTCTTLHAAQHNRPENDAQTVISFDNTKAGLQNVDKEKTEALIKELSQGSPFYVNEQRKAAAREVKIQEMLKKAALFEQQVVLPHQQEQQCRFGSHTAAPRTPYAQLANTVAAMEAELLFAGDELGLKREKVFAHLDMDMFYAAVEEKKDPSLRLKPLGVGSNAMLSTTNYVARQYGVRSGMPGFIGKKLCPHLIIKPCDYPSYKQVAETVRDVVRAYDPDFSSAGWDELTMELSGYLSEHPPYADDTEEEREDTEHTTAAPALQREEGAVVEDRCKGEDDENDGLGRGHTARMRRTYAAAERVVADIRAKITAATQLTASAGIAPTATLAKIASNFNKPDGQHTLRLYTRKDVMSFMHGLACRQVPGIGKSQEHILRGLGIHTVGDIYARRVLLFHLITPKTFRFLLSTALGVGGMFEDYSSTANADAADGDGGGFDGDGELGGTDRKSIGQERTFYKLKNTLELETIARRNLLDAMRRMKDRHLLTRQMVLKLKHVNFRVKQYSHPVSPASDDEEALQRVLNTLITPVASCYADYRLLGVRLEKLTTQEQIARDRQHDGGKERHEQPTLLEMMTKGKSGAVARRKKRCREGASATRSPASCFSISTDTSRRSSGSRDRSSDEGAKHESDEVCIVDNVDTSPHHRSGDRHGYDVAKDESTASVELVTPAQQEGHGKEQEAVGCDGDDADVIVID